MMESQHVFGGARIKVTAEPLSEKTPMNRAGLTSLQAFLIVMHKAYSSGLEDNFHALLRIFLEEVDNYLDDKRIEEDEMSRLDADTVDEMEDFMNQRKRRK